MSGFDLGFGLVYADAPAGPGRIIESWHCLSFSERNAFEADGSAKGPRRI